MTKTYIGTKKVDAEPMTRGNYNKYRGWEIPADGSSEDEGYLVKYSGDYVSWSPKDAFEEAYREVEKYPLGETAILMQSNDFKERFIAEYIQLKIRRDGLSNMLQNYKLGTLPFNPTCSYELLRKQLVHMNAYLDCLEERARLEDIAIEL